MTNKIITILALCVIALAILAYSLWNDDDKAERAGERQEESVTELAEEAKPDNTAVEESPKEESVAVENKETPTEVEDEKEAIEDEKLCQLANEYNDWYPKNNSYESEQFMQEVKEWAFSHGYFETEYSKGSLDIKKKSDYDYYAIKDLEEMAKAGDSMANVRLAYRLYLKGDEKNMERAQPYCERAIVDGYTALVMCKTSYLTSQLYAERRKEKEGEEKADPERQRELELEYKAWGKVSKALGDELGSKMTSNMLGDEEFEFKDEEITQRFEAIVEDVKQRRQRLGIEEITHPPVPDLLTYVLENDKDSREKLNACFE